MQRCFCKNKYTIQNYIFYFHNIKVALALSLLLIALNCANWLVQIKYSAYYNHDVFKCSVIRPLTPVMNHVEFKDERLLFIEIFEQLFYSVE